VHKARLAEWRRSWAICQIKERQRRAADRRARERIEATLRGEMPDRVPVNYSANPGIDRRLKEHFGLGPDDSEQLRQVLGVDIRGVGAPYKGPRLHAEIAGRRVDPQWGVRTRHIAHDTGAYWDYCDFPLMDADEATVAAWPMPSPEDFDYSGVAAACRAKAACAVHVGNPGLGCVMNTAGFLRNMEQMFVDLITNDPAGLLLIKRRMNIEFEVARRVLAAAEGGVEAVQRYYNDQPEVLDRRQLFGGAASESRSGEELLVRLKLAVQR
jgi:uroporphyrinogen decarboxylase